MKYYHYFEYPNWQKHRDMLISYREEKGFAKEAWTGVNLDQFKNDLPELILELKEQGIELLQIIFIAFRQTNLDSMDPNDPSSVYIHIDSKDDYEHLEKGVAPTTFAPEYVLNIPLINCDQSETLHYELIDPTLPGSNHAWGGGCVDYKNIKEVSRFTLDRPAILKVDVPHAVHNPTLNPRIVASMRITSSCPAIQRLTNDV